MGIQFSVSLQIHVFPHVSRNLRVSFIRAMGRFCLAALNEPSLSNRAPSILAFVSFQRPSEMLRNLLQECFRPANGAVSRLSPPLPCLVIRYCN